MNILISFHSAGALSSGLSWMRSNRSFCRALSRTLFRISSLALAIYLGTLEGPGASNQISRTPRCFSGFLRSTFSLDPAGDLGLVPNSGFLSGLVVGTGRFLCDQVVRQRLKLLRAGVEPCHQYPTLPG